MDAICLPTQKEQYWLRLFWLLMPFAATRKMKQEGKGLSFLSETAI